MTELVETYLDELRSVTGNETDVAQTNRVWIRALRETLRERGSYEGYIAPDCSCVRFIPLWRGVTDEELQALQSLLPDKKPRAKKTLAERVTAAERKVRDAYILELYASGLSGKEISVEMQLPYSTVYGCLQRNRRKGLA